MDRLPVSEDRQTSSDGQSGMGLRATGRLPLITDRQPVGFGGRPRGPSGAHSPGPWAGPVVSLLVQGRSVTAPVEAELTERAYFARTPRVTFGVGACQRFRRRSSSSSDTTNSMVLATASMVMVSPFSTR